MGKEVAASRATSSIMPANRGISPMLAVRKGAESQSDEYGSRFLGRDPHAMKTYSSENSDRAVDDALIGGNLVA